MWWIIGFVAAVILFFRWNYVVGEMNKHYDRVMEEEMRERKLHSAIDDLDEAVRSSEIGK